MQNNQMFSQLNVSTLEEVTVMNKDSMSDHGTSGYEEGSHPHGPRGPLSRSRRVTPAPSQKILAQIAFLASVLDCGCGIGKPVSSMIAGSGRTPFGIDLSLTMIKPSKKHFPHGTFAQCNMLDYTADPATFAGVTAILSVFGLDRAGITRKAGNFFDWIQPGGYLLLCVFGAEDCKTRPEQYDPDRNQR